MPAPRGRKDKDGMHWIDVSIMAAYMLGMVVVGMLARGKDEDAEDYFTAGGALNNWFNTIVVGLSIAGTFFSGISFISYPSVVYSSGILLPVWGLLIGMPLYYVVLRFWFLPRYLSRGWKYPYEVLEHRFGPGTRTVAASLYILMRVGWMAAMIYAPTVAIMTMGRLDEKWFWPIVLITGLSNTIYTVVSGIRGVIVTEAIQMLVIIFGVSATIASAWWQLPVSFSTAIADLAHSGRLDVFNFSLDPKVGLTVWTVVLGLTVGNLTNYIGDQMSLQRYLASGDVRAASRSFAVNVVGVVIVVVLLTLVGLSLFVFY
jgi:SSS family solute:Na+ symporter